MPEFFVFKAGKYPQGNWPEERVKSLVDSYDPKNNYEAPAVIGHRFFNQRDADEYAHGWVESLRMDGDGKVYATINNFSIEAAHAIAEKKLSYISVEIFEFDKVEEGQAPYLRAVALLGRNTPAVMGTKITSAFSALFKDGVVNTTNTENNICMFTRKLSAADIKSLSAEDGQKNKKEDFAMSKPEKTTEELEKELEKSKSQAAAFQQELLELKNSGAKKDAEAFFSVLRDEGKLPPALFEKTVALDAKMNEEERKELRSVFSALKVEVDLSGAHKADKKNAPASPAPFGKELSAQVRAFQKEKGLASFSDAADALFAAKPELFEEESND